MKRLEPLPQGDYGNGVDAGFDDTQHPDGGANASDGQTGANNDIRSSSAESLLSNAEFYTDRALAAGSGLPLAKLVKGQALALRGQHQVLLFSPMPTSKCFPTVVPSRSNHLYRFGGFIESMSFRLPPAQSLKIPEFQSPVVVESCGFGVCFAMIHFLLRYQQKRRTSGNARSSASPPEHSTYPYCLKHLYTCSATFSRSIDTERRKVLPGKHRHFTAPTLRPKHCQSPQQRKQQPGNRGREH